MHIPNEIIISEHVDLVYDQVLFTDLEVGANWPDILIKDKTAKKTYLSDVSCPKILTIKKWRPLKLQNTLASRGNCKK